MFAQLEQFEKKNYCDSAPLKQPAKDDDSLVAKITLQSSFINLYYRGDYTHIQELFTHAISYQHSLRIVSQRPFLF